MMGSSSKSGNGGASWLDRAVAFVSPEAGVKRLAARSILNLFDYDGAKRDGRRGTGGGSMWRNGSPESPRMATDAVRLMWESRDMEQNFCIWDGILTRIVRYALGTIRWQSMTGDSKVDAAYEAYWQDWCKQADVTKRHSFYTLVRLVVRSMLRDRDVGLLTSEPDGDLRIQGIEADRIGNPYVVATGEEKIVGGFHLVEGGAIESVDIFKRSRMNAYALEENVPIERFLHVFDPKRLDQYRGVTWGAAAMPHMRDLYEALGNEMSAIKFAGSYVGFVESESPYGDQGIESFDGPKDKDGKPTYKVTPGMVQRLVKGETMKFAPGITRPSGSFLAFFETKVREIAVGLEVPYGFVWNLALLGGVTARIELGQMSRSLNWLRDIAKEKVLEPMKDRVLRRGVALREIPPHRNRGTGRWSFGADITADVGNDVTADIAKLNAGLVTEQELIEGKYGGDFEDSVRQSARAVQIRQQVAQETGVPIELQTTRLPQATQMLAGMNSRGDPEAEGAVLGQVNGGAAGGGLEDPESPAPSGLLATHGKDAVKGLIDVMKKLNTGELTRDQAVLILMSSYGVSEEDAEAMVPPVVTPKGEEDR